MNCVNCDRPFKAGDDTESKVAYGEAGWRNCQRQNDIRKVEGTCYLALGSGYGIVKHRHVKCPGETPVKLVATLNGYPLPIDLPLLAPDGPILKTGDKLVIEAVKPSKFKVFYEAQPNVLYAHEGDVCIGESFGTVVLVVPKFTHPTSARAYAEKLVIVLNAARDRGEI